MEPGSELISQLVGVLSSGLSGDGAGVDDLLPSVLSSDDPLVPQVLASLCSTGDFHLSAFRRQEQDQSGKLAPLLSLLIRP